MILTTEMLAVELAVALGNAFGSMAAKDRTHIFPGMDYAYSEDTAFWELGQITLELATQIAAKTDNLVTFSEWWDSTPYDVFSYDVTTVICETLISGDPLTTELSSQTRRQIVEEILRHLEHGDDGSHAPAAPLDVRATIAEILGTTTDSVTTTTEADVKPPRSCTECGSGMWEGYLVDDGYTEYFCSDTCLHVHYTAYEYQKKFENDEAFYADWSADD